MIHCLVVADASRARLIATDAALLHFEERQDLLHAEPRLHDPRRLAERLVELIDEGTFERLILVAPPQVLGTLREVMPARLSRKIAASLDLDLTQLPDREVVARVREVVAR